MDRVEAIVLFIFVVLAIAVILVLIVSEPMVREKTYLTIQLSNGDIIKCAEATTGIRGGHFWDCLGGSEYWNHYNFVVLDDGRRN